MLLSRLLTPAYIDPGTGSYMLQLLIGFAVGGLYLLKVYWRRITGLGRRNSDESGDDGDLD